MTVISHTKESLAEAIDVPLEKWRHQCHAISLAIVKSGVLGQFARVARGTCTIVPGQHSWVVVGHDCYDRHTAILDPTAWTYDNSVGDLLWTTLAGGQHRPHGTGSIWQWGQPARGRGKPIEFAPEVLDRLLADREGRAFYDILDLPFDRQGWATLANAPVEGWPARQFTEAMLDTPELSSLVRIDIEGMLTDRNPNGLYLAETS